MVIGELGRGLPTAHVVWWLMIYNTAQKKILPCADHSFRMLNYQIYVFVGAIHDLNLFTEMKAAIAISDHDCTKI